MKILKIYIENFGCLSKYTKEFTEGTNTIIEENGFGKTTLANFIKAMFYGFPGSKKSYIDNDRLRYAPWQGGAFGGYIDFEHEGTKYRVERTFNPSGSTKDTFKLYDLDTNKESKKFTKNIGEEIFKVDIDGYIRSSYIPQINVNWSDNKKLSQNLSTVLEETENEDVSDAIKRLETESKKYVKIGGKGLIAETETRIAHLENELETASLSKETTKSLKEKLLKIESLLEQNQKKLTSIKQDIKLANKQNEKDAIYNHYKTLVTDTQKIKKELDEVLIFFKDRVVKKEEVSHYYELLEKLSILQVEIKKVSTNSYINEEYQKLDNYFKQNASEEISEEVIKEKLLENDKLKKLSIEREEIAKKIDEVDTKLQNNTVLTPTHKMIYILLGFIGAIFVISGSIMIIDNLINGLNVLLLTIGIFLGILGIAFSVLSLTILIARANQNHHKLLKYKQLEKEALEEKENLVNNYKETDDAFSKLSARIKEFVIKYEVIESNLISKFKEDDDYLIQLNNIYNNYKTYIKLKLEYLKNKERANYFELEFNKIKTELDSFTKYYLPNLESFPALKTIQTNIDKYELLKIRYADANKKLNDFLKENEVDYNHKENIYNISELEKEETSLENIINKAIKEKLDLEAQIKDNEAIVDRSFEIETQLIIEKEQLGEYQNKYRIVTKTIEYLTIASEKLSCSYLSSMQDSFNKYLKFIIKNDDIFELSTELEIMTESNGTKKEIGYLSKGYQDIVYFCARLALLDAMFKGVKPTLILDDPFTNLDENKLELALKLLKELEKEYQIIYLICHESRKNLG